MELPLAITRAGGQRISEIGLTRNISSGGVLFTAAHPMDIGGPIEYVITLSGRKEHSVNLRCVGKVVRFEKAGLSEQSRFEVAATLERYEFVRPGR